MGIKVVTPPIVDPIAILGLSALKLHLNEAADVTDNDSLITTYCQVAWDYCERYSWRQLLTASLRLSLPGWVPEYSRSESYRCKASIIALPRPRVASIESVQYYDNDNALQTLNPDDWSADLESDVAELLIYDFPTVYDRPDAVRINYTAGFGTTAAAFPPVLLHAVRLLVGGYYATREPSDSDTTTVDALLEAIWIRDERLAEYE